MLFWNHYFPSQKWRDINKEKLSIFFFFLFTWQLAYTLGVKNQKSPIWAELPGLTSKKIVRATQGFCSQLLYFPELSVFHKGRPWPRTRGLRDQRHVSEYLLRNVQSELDSAVFQCHGGCHLQNKWIHYWNLTISLSREGCQPHQSFKLEWGAVSPSELRILKPASHVFRLHGKQNLILTLLPRTR